MDLKLQDGIALYKNGEKDKAARLFYHIAKTDPGNEQAWLWLAASVDDTSKKRYCFQQALAINPDNPAVQNELANLDKEPFKDSPEEEKPAGVFPTVTVVPTIDPTARPGYYIPPTYQVNYPKTASTGLEAPPKIKVEKPGVPLRMVLRILFDVLLLAMAAGYLVASSADIWPVNLILRAGKMLYEIYQHIGLVTLAYVPIEHGNYLAEALIVFAAINFFLPNKTKTIFGVVWVIAGAWMGYSVLFLAKGSPLLWGYFGMILLFSLAVLYIIIGLLRLTGIAEEPPEDKYAFSSTHR